MLGLTQCFAVVIKLHTSWSLGVIRPLSEHLQVLDFLCVGLAGLAVRLDDLGRGLH